MKGVTSAVFLKGIFIYQCKNWTISHDSSLHILYAFQRNNVVYDGDEDEDGDGDGDEKMKMRE